MKMVVNVALIIAAISLILGIISRITLAPMGPMGIEAQAFLEFTNTCLLVALTFAVLQLLSSKS